MPRKRPPYVECWRDRHGRIRLYFRRGKGPRIPLRGEVGSDDFHRTYIAALENHGSLKLERGTTNLPGTIAALIVSYQKSTAHLSLRQTTKRGYKTRLEILRVDHGHRTVKGLTRERIEDGILKPYFDRPGAALSLLKMLRILIRHAMSLDRGNLLKLEHDPSIGIKRPKTKEIRAWTDDEIAAFEERWPIGTRERAAYALMLYAGAARADVHRITWRHVSEIDVRYTRSKTGVGVHLGVHKELKKAIAALSRDHITIINTEHGKPFTVGGFSGFLRDAMAAAGLPLDCKPHGLRKTLGRRMADAGCTAHEIMAALGHTTLAEAERYTREADRRHAGRRAIFKLEGRTENKNAQTGSERFGEIQKTEGPSK